MALVHRDQPLRAALGALLLAAASEALGCSCAARPGPVSPAVEATELYHQHGAVALVRILKVQRSSERSFEDVVAEVEVLESFKGPADLRRMRTPGSGAGCGVELRQGEQRLYFMTRDGAAYLCSNLSRISERTLLDELRRLKAQQVPRPGVDHDSWERIELAHAGGPDCLEIVSRAHVITLALADLRAMALDAGRIMGSATEARLRRLFQTRTQALLARVSRWPRPEACVVAQVLDNEDRYVVTELLKAGRAAVRAPREADASAVWMRHLGRRTGHSGEGEILFYLQRGGEPFFSVSWWVS
jgi:hypothetical protein